MQHSMILLLLGALPLVAATSPEPRHRHLMMVVSKALPGITIYDADTDEPVCRAKVGLSPHEAAFSLDGHTAYVPVYGTTSVGKPGTDEHTLAFIRTSDCQIVGTLDTGENKRPHGIAVGNSGTIYLTSEVSKSLLLIDPRTRQIIATIPTNSPYSHMIAVTHDEKKVFISNVQSKTVSVIDVPGRKLEKVIDTGAENQRMTLSPDQKLFVTNLGPEKKIAFYRTSDYQLDFTIPIEGTPFVSRFSADGKYLYDVGTDNGQLRAWKIDFAARKVLAVSDSVGSAVGSLAVSPFNHDVYVTDPTSSKISVIDPQTWKIVKTIPADKTPDAIFFKTIQ